MPTPNPNTLFEPVYASHFASEIGQKMGQQINKDNILVNQSNLCIQEDTNHEVLIWRGSARQAVTKQFFKQLGLAIPKPLQITHIAENNSIDPVAPVSAALWLSPDEFWLLVQRHHTEEIFHLHNQSNRSGVLVDNSGSYAILQISGEQSIELLQRLMSYDIEQQLPVGKVISSHVGAATGVVYSESDNIKLIIRNSYALYVAQLLRHTVSLL